jgi:hypothetical protein
VSYINRCIGVDLGAGQIASLLSRMGLNAEASPSGDSVHVEVPPSRSDILHDCDVMEVWPAPLPTFHLSICPAAWLHSISSVQGMGRGGAGSATEVKGRVCHTQARVCQGLTPMRLS